VHDTDIPPGQPYQWKTLFERFTCRGQTCSAAFENLLSVTTWYDPPPSTRFWLGYNLSKELKGQILNQKEILVLDQGTIWAEQQTTSTGAIVSIVYGDKTVVLDNPAAQAMYHASLLFAELGGQQAEMACCPIPPPPGACPYSPPPPLP